MAMKAKPKEVRFTLLVYEGEIVVRGLKLFPRNWDEDEGVEGLVMFVVFGTLVFSRKFKKSDMHDAVMEYSASLEDSADQMPLMPNLEVGRYSYSFQEEKRRREVTGDCSRGMIASKHSGTLSLRCAERKVIAARSPGSRCAFRLISPDSSRFRGGANARDSALRVDVPSTSSMRSYARAPALD
ncbi:hypothetical protein AXG93_1862s1310 [Marchantia polymorpha subsp. ruderalis]|uniref:Uncharacterized protein n=1 Tax=Marchantia polymorpha subsp. ruderalis TaxID=1480154 RepID=A0A176W932_MARPO|nr:hypothetical protein AXG93_1862s1310 [Marchantia polymorpha subsp. ruderalis]